MLALKPNHNIIRGSFVKNVLSATLPSGIAMFLSVAMTYAFANVIGVASDTQQLATVAMFSMTFTGLIALLILLWPYDKANVGIASLATIGTAGCFVVLPWALGILVENPTPMFVAIPSTAILFIALNVLVMGAIIVTGKLIMKRSQKSDKAN